VREQGNPAPSEAWQDHQPPRPTQQGTQGYAHVATTSRLDKAETTYQTSSSDSPNALARSVVRTVISGANEAFNLLFDVVPNRDQGHVADLSGAAGNQPSSVNSVSRTVQNQDEPPEMHSLSNGPSQHFPGFSSSLIRTWQSCHFVRMGWLTAREAIQYVDLYVYQMFSPHTSLRPIKVLPEHVATVASVDELLFQP
jgi:hypothetical protein